jgi:hypothetical protein
MTVVLTAATLLLVAAARRCCTGTTLVTTWWWGMAASFAGIIASILAACDVVAQAVAGLAWYGVSIVSLCAPISVLGARRPGSRVWGWFVLAPLVAVLGWPAAAALSANQVPQALQLEAPPLIGFALVLVMGCGNYVGTRFGLSACLFAAGQCLLVLPATRWASRWSMAPDECRATGALLWLLSAAAAHLALRSFRRDDHGVDRLWFDFRNLFGIVWAHRLQERVNAEAAGGQWPARLTPAGILWQPDADESVRSRTSLQIEHTLRWLLRRFVDEPWIDLRIRAAADSANTN